MTNKLLTRKIIANAKRARVTPAQYVDVLDTLIRGRELRKKPARAQDVVPVRPLFEGEVPAKEQYATPADAYAAYQEEIKLLPGAFGHPNLDSVELVQLWRSEQEEKIRRLWND